MGDFRDLLSQRLVLRESVVTLPSVTKISSRLKDLREKQDKGASDAFIRELLLFKLESLKATKVLSTCDSEIRDYDALESDLAGQIQGTEETIASLEKQLEQEKKIRKHREECEHVSRDVTKLPSRAALEKQQRKMDDEIKTCDQAIVDMNDRIQQRVKQFKALLEAIADLKGSLKEEEEMLRLALAQQEAREGAEEEDDNMGGENEGGEGEGRGARGSGGGGAALGQGDEDGDEEGGAEGPEGAKGGEEGDGEVMEIE